jgi:hypothetical protein
MSNKEKNSLDVLGLKSYGDAINTVAKGTIEGIGAFLGKICLPAAEEFGLLLKDKIAYYRTINLAKVIEKTKKKMGELNGEASGTMSPKVLKEIVEESSWVKDETVQDMWAGLLAGTAIESKESDDALIYTNILKRLSAFQARLVNLIYSDPRICSISNVKPPRRFLYPKFDPENPLTYRAKQFLELSPVPLNEIVSVADVTSEEILNNEIHYSIALGRFVPQILALESEKLIARWEAMNLQLRFWPTLDGLDFYMRCTGYSVYPIEAYILTRQHWCELQGIDPFSWGKTDYLG